MTVKISNSLCICTWWCLLSQSKHQSAVSCDGLPSGWKEVKTDTQFPVPPGDEVSLKCSPGHTLTGVSTVTCEEGTTFSPADSPSCVPGLFIENFLFHSPVIHSISLYRDLFKPLRGGGGVFGLSAIGSFS